MANCHQVAKYFLSKQDNDSGDLVSNLKLQKLLYYAQGFHLALFDQVLFPEEIRAWTHGPVVPEIYFAYKNRGAEAIPAPTDFNSSELSAPEAELIDEVYEVYGQYSAWKLRNMTHVEPPWADAYKAAPDSLISHPAMQKYFKTLTK